MIPVRPNPKKTYADKSADFTMTKKSVTHRVTSFAIAPNYKAPIMPTWARTAAIHFVGSGRASLAWFVVLMIGLTIQINKTSIAKVR